MGRAERRARRRRSKVIIAAAGAAIVIVVIVALLGALPAGEERVEGRGVEASPKEDVFYVGRSESPVLSAALARGLTPLRARAPRCVEGLDAPPQDVLARVVLTLRIERDGRVSALSVTSGSGTASARDQRIERCLAPVRRELRLGPLQRPLTVIYPYAVIRAGERSESTALDHQESKTRVTIS